MTAARAAGAIRRSVWRDEGGTTAIEFAMLAPVMILLIAGAIELGRLAMLKATLEIAVSSAARETRVDLGQTEQQRLTNFQNRVRSFMESFASHPDKVMVSQAGSASSFSSSFPEGYEDQNGNKRYDGPSGSFDGEPFDDRNRNGVRDEANVKSGSTGAAGAVVTYSATYPVEPLFDFLGRQWGMQDVELNSTVVLRNEPIVKNSR